jgi:Flp pilus assembly protein TadG
MDRMAQLSGWSAERVAVEENLTSAAEAGHLRAVIAGLKPCAAQKLRCDWLRRAWRDCGAAEIAEAAVVLPLLFAFILGIFQFARVYMIYSTMQRAALEGAQAAAGGSCATCGNVSLDPTGVGITMQAVFNTAHIDYSTITPPTSTPALKACVLPGPGALVTCETPAGSPNVCVQRNVVLGSAASGTPVCGASVSFVYPYAFSLPAVSASPPYVSRQTYSMNLKAQAQVKGEN